VRVDVASELTPLVATKLVIYTLGTLVHLFLMVLILGNRRLRRFEWLLFTLMVALFMWYAGNLLALNIGLFYGAGPPVLSGFSRILTLTGFMAAVPLLVHVQVEYLGGFVPLRLRDKLLVAGFYLPLVASPWVVKKSLGQLGVEPLVALGWPFRLFVAWAVTALLLAVKVNLPLSRRRREVDPTPARFHGYLAGLQGFLAVGLALVYLPQTLPHVGGLGGYFPTALMLVAIIPSGLMGYSIFRYNFLDLRVQRNVAYSVIAAFGFLLYLNFMRRLSGWLEARDVLPAAVTEGIMIFVLVVLLEPVKRLINQALHSQFVSEFEKVQKLAAEVEEHAKQTGDVNSLQAFVEERVPGELGLESVKLWQGTTRIDAQRTLNQKKARLVPIHRNRETIAFLEVVPATAEVSGEQLAALEIFSERLTAAWELCQLIADKVKLERELAEKAKMAFLGEMAARIAHNVKNPLSSMKTIVQLLEEDQTLPEHARRDCRMLVEEIDRLNRNISQVLRYAKPARDTDRPADLASVIARVTAILQMEAERLHVKLEVDAEEPCPIEGGEEAASDIISNLVVNALEASREGGTIWIRLVHPQNRPDKVELSVEDEGRGIPEDKLERVFQPFFTTRPGGTGLGLAIVKRRLDEIGGLVECESPVRRVEAGSAHPGTRFVVQLRRAASPPAAVRTEGAHL
jgi:signal transduction histidine kinase